MNKKYYVSNILDLPIKSKWYEMIENGIKKEEYREIKEYWEKRLQYGTLFFRPYDYVRIRYGYTKRTMMFKLVSIRKGMGKTEWGAPKNKEVYILSLGDRV